MTPSPSHHQELLTKARSNDIPATDFNGERVTHFAYDPGDLYSYLKSKTAPDPTIEEVMDVFERQFHELPQHARQEIRLEAVIPNSTRDDDVVGTFVTKYGAHYTTRNALPPLGRDYDSVRAVEQPGQHSTRTLTPDNDPAVTPALPGDAIGIPLLSEIANAGYRTGRAINYAAVAIKRKVTTTPDDSTVTTSETSTQIEK